MKWRTIAQATSTGPIQCVGPIEPSGPTLLFLHGVTRTHRDWSLVMSGLAARFTPWGLDFRGHGGSARSPRGYRVVNYIDDAVHIARDVIAGPVILVGHSLGAMVALAAASRLREQALGVIMEDPPFETLGKNVEQTVFHSQFLQFRDILKGERWHSVADLAKQLAEVRLDNPQTGQSARLGDVRDEASIRFHASTLATMDPECLTPIVEGDWLAGYDWKTLASSIDVPVLLMQADPDRGGMLRDADAETLRESIHDLTVVRYPEVGHQIHSLARESYLATLVPFLESIHPPDLPAQI
ncbi:alpha/beta hydrolase [bacterium]|nr:alpha/beta hydrolase [bacterium]